MKKVLFISGIGGDTRRYRCLHHQEQLALYGIASLLREANDTQLYMDVLEHDLVILHRVQYSDLIVDLLEIAQLRSVPVIFETDDLIFEPTLAKQIAYIDSLPPEEAMRFREGLFAQAQCFSRCDYVLTTNRYLATAAQKHDKQVYIQRNAFSAEMISCAEKAFAQTEKQSMTNQASDVQNEIITLGYFSGTGSHNRDFASISEALLTVLRQYPNLQLIIGGYLELGHQFVPFKDRIHRTAFVPWQELPKIIAQVDINLAPLELDNPFCHAKSEIKYTEAALVGVPTIASATEAFAYAITHGENGFLAKSHEDWIVALRQLIDNAQKRKEMGNLARQRVYLEYTPQMRSQELLATLTEIESCHAAIDADPAQIAIVVAKGMKRELDALTVLHQQAQEEVARQKQQFAELRTKPQFSPDLFWRKSYDEAQRQYTLGLADILERLQKRQSQS